MGYLIKARTGPLFDQWMSLNLKPSDSVYFMGIGGTAMASLAVYLKQRGFKVFGSDQNIYPPMSSALKQAGIPVSLYSANNVQAGIKLAIVGNVIGRDHPEMPAIQKKEIPCLSFPEFMGQAILKGKKNIVVAGTQGKSTNTSLISHMGRSAGQNPGFFIGARAKNFSHSLHSTDSPWFVIEGDEYDSAFFAKRPKFFYYNPFAVLLTGAEFDHGDIYSDLNEITNLFQNLVKKIPKEGWLVACSHNKSLESIIKGTKASVATYGLKEGDWTIKNRRLEEGWQKFDICHKGESYPCSLSLYGEHNALNALGAFALSRVLNWPKARQGLKSFQGLKRRMEYKGEFQGAKIYEDFAHHPTAIEASLSALREKYPLQSLIAVFEPRSFTSRLNVFQKDYIKAFSKADLVLLAPVYNSAKIPKEKRFSPQRLIQDLKPKAFYYDSFKNLETELIKKISRHNIVVFMSSGDFGGLLRKIEKKA